MTRGQTLREPVCSADPGLPWPKGLCLALEWARSADSGWEAHVESSRPPTGPKINWKRHLKLAVLSPRVAIIATCENAVGF